MSSRALNGKSHSDSGACFDVSDAGFDDFAQQQNHACMFLENNCGIVQDIVLYPGVDHCQLDFAINLTTSWINSDVLLPRFLKAAADAGVSVELSHYRPEAGES